MHAQPDECSTRNGVVNGKTNTAPRAQRGYESNRSGSGALGLLLIAALLAALVAGCGVEPADAPIGWSPPPDLLSTAPPPPGRVVPAGADLQAIIDESAPGTVLHLAPGTHTGPLRIRQSLTIWGPREAEIRSVGRGSTVTVAANETRLLGFTVNGSGSRYDLLDAAIRIEADDVRVEGVKIINALFGVLAEKATRVTLRGNEVFGPTSGPIGLRGDGIRLWETRESRIEGNLVTDGRDVVIWYSPNNRVAHNTVRNGRYGTHFMYSHNNEVIGNRYLHNTVGIFVMYSRNVLIRDNQMLHSLGPAGIGLGVKESGNLNVQRNAIIHNTIGIYLDTSPLTIGDLNTFVGNDLRLGEVGVKFHSSQRANIFRHNNFRDNTDPVRVDGGGDAMGVEWIGNHFDDYRGYDLDGDGVGDVAYELRKLSTTLTSRNPQLELLRGTPSLALTDMASHISPLYRPQLVLADPQPRMQPISADDIPPEMISGPTTGTNSAEASEPERAPSPWSHTHDDH